jgi:hypothetical protein
VSFSSQLVNPIGGVFVLFFFFLGEFLSFGEFFFPEINSLSNTPPFEKSPISFNSKKCFYTLFKARSQDIKGF